MVSSPIFSLTSFVMGKGLSNGYMYLFWEGSSLQNICSIPFCMEMVLTGLEKIIVQT